MTLKQAYLEHVVENGLRRELLNLLLPGDEPLDLNFKKGLLGKTPLMIACERGDLEMVNILLKQPGIDVNKGDINLTTPLDLAITYNHLPVIQRLLAHPGLDPNVAQRTSGNTALHLAVTYREIPILRTLLNDHRVDVNHRNRFDETPLSMAINISPMEFVHRLLLHPNIDPQPLCGFLGMNIFEQKKKYSLSYRWKKHPEMTMEQLHSKYETRDEFAAAIFGLIIFQCEGLLSVELVV